MSVPGWRSVSSTTRIRTARHCSSEVCREVNRLGEGTSAYWHDWKTTDMVIWDNWRMLHAVEGCDAKYERRTCAPRSRATTVSAISRTAKRSAKSIATLRPSTTPWRRLRAVHLGAHG